MVLYGDWRIGVLLSPAQSGHGVWEGGINKVTQLEWELFCLVTWTHFIPAEYKRLSSIQFSLFAWTWHLSFGFCCIPPWADLFLTSEKKYVNQWVFDLLGDLCILIYCLDMDLKIKWPGKFHEKENKLEKTCFPVYISVYHFL